MSATRVQWVRVLGLGALSAGTAYAYLWSTHAADGSWTLPSGCAAALTYPTLVGVGEVGSSDLRPLDTIGGDDSLTLSILHGPTSSDVWAQGLRTPVDSSGGAMRVARYASPTDTTIYVDDSSGITSTPTIVWVGAEAMTVTATGAGTLTVTRGACASIAAPVTLADLGGYVYGPAVHTTPPTPIGAWVEVGYSVAGSGVAVTVYRGVVDAIGISDSRYIEVTTRGLLAYLRDRRWQAPTGTVTGAPPNRPLYRAPTVSGYGLELVDAPLVQAIVEAPRFYVSADTWGDSSGAQWARCRITDADSGRWVVVACTYDSTVAVSGRRLALYALDTTITLDEIQQVGDVDGVLTLDGGEAGDHAREVLTRPQDRLRVEYVRAQTGTASAILSAWLTASEPVGWASGIPSAWVDLSGLTYSAASGALPFSSRDGVRWLYAQPAGRTLLDAIAEDLLLPLGYAIGADDGQIVGVDWSPDTSTVTQSLGTSDARAVQWRWARRGYDGARAAAQVSTSGGSAIVLSDRVDPRQIASAIVSVPCRRAWTDAEVADGVPGTVTGRQARIVQTYSTALPVCDVVVDTGSVGSVGDLVELQRPDLVTPAGGIGSPEVVCVVIARRRNLADDRERLSLLGLTWSEPAADVWAPSGEITSATSGSVTIAAAAYTDDDAAVWSTVTLPDEVQILDADGAVADSGTATVWDAGTRTLTVTGMVGTPTAGQIVVLGPYATASTANRARFAWLADTDGTIGADAGDNWGA